LILIKAFFLGIAQGLTEFLPVSSSGHLFLLQGFLGRGANDNGSLLSFFIFLHLSTLCAVVIYLYRNLYRFLSGPFILNVLIMTGVTGSIALFIRFFLSHFFLNKYFLMACFFSNALILLSVRKTADKRGWKSLNLKDSLFLGALQGVAFLPGISRSGITITGFLKRGFSKEESFILSFLMVIPVIIGAFALECRELIAGGFSLKVLLMGFFTAFLSGICALAFLRKAVIADKFRNFSYYCFFIALVTLFL
jgi:undecaprenyl-diphosphatase